MKTLRKLKKAYYNWKFDRSSKDRFKLIIESL